MWGLLRGGGVVGGFIRGVGVYCGWWCGVGEEERAGWDIGPGAERCAV